MIALVSSDPVRLLGDSDSGAIATISLGACSSKFLSLQRSSLLTLNMWEHGTSLNQISKMLAGFWLIMFPHLRNSLQTAYGARNVANSSIITVTPRAYWAAKWLDTPLVMPNGICMGIGNVPWFYFARWTFTYSFCNNFCSRQRTHMWL